MISSKRLSSSIRLRDDTLTRTITPGLREHKINDNEALLHIYQTPSVEPYHQIQLSVILRRYRYGLNDTDKLVCSLVMRESNSSDTIAYEKAS